jgi:protein-tyrosine-phosphatase
MTGLLTPLPQAVLFACNHNVIRSPMAAALFRDRWGKFCYVDSCGVYAGELDPLAVEVMDEYGLDITKHRPKTFADLEDANYDLVISLTPEAHHNALEMTHTMAIEAEYWPTYDPSLCEGARGQRLDEYRALRDSLEKRITERFKGWRAP